MQNVVPPVICNPVEVLIWHVLQIEAYKRYKAGATIFLKSINVENVKHAVKNKLTKISLLYMRKQQTADLWQK